MSGHGNNVTGRFGIRRRTSCDGHPHIDENLATSTIRAYLLARGLMGTFDIQGTKATVVVSRKIPMRILGIIGVGERTIRVNRTVDVVDG